MYDSTRDTLDHIVKVRQFLDKIVKELSVRGDKHDLSKLEEPEKSIIDKYAPRLKEMMYNSPEYKQCLKKMRVMVDYHHSHNRHHPEFHKNGVADMNLVDIIEMFCDWFAASQRNTGGNIQKSIEIGKEKFGISDQLASIFKNTIGILEK